MDQSEECGKVCRPGQLHQLFVRHGEHCFRLDAQDECKPVDDAEGSIKSTKVECDEADHGDGECGDDQFLPQRDGNPHADREHRRGNGTDLVHYSCIEKLQQDDPVAVHRGGSKKNCRKVEHCGVCIWKIPDGLDVIDFAAAHCHERNRQRRQGIETIQFDWPQFPPAAPSGGVKHKEGEVFQYVGQRHVRRIENDAQKNRRRSEQQKCTTGRIIVV